MSTTLYTEWLGEWSSATEYAVGAGVAYDGANYTCLKANKDVAPSSSTTDWELLPSYLAVIDPPAIAPERTAVNLNEGPVTIEGGEGNGIAWSPAEAQQYFAENEWGETPVSARYKNRTATIPLVFGGANITGVGEEGGTQEEAEEAASKLELKAAQAMREGAVCMRQAAGGDPLYCDIVTAELTVPDLWAESGIEPDVSLVLEVLPDFYGPEVTLEKQSGEGYIAAVLQQSDVDAVIAGDLPGRPTISLYNPSASEQQNAALFGLRSRYYSAAETAKLAYHATELTKMNGATEAEENSAYGKHWVKLAEPIVSTWMGVLATDLSTKKPLTHAGSYRVWARCYGTIGQRVQLRWSNDDATVPTTNSPLTLPASSAFYVVDLGVVNLQGSPVGSRWWRGNIEVETGATSDAFYVDEVWFQPLSEGAGVLNTLLSPGASAVKATSSEGTSEEKTAFHTGNEWTKATEWFGTGASVRVPPLDESAALFGSKLGFALPSGATVQGIEVTSHAALARTPGTAQLVKAGALTGTAVDFVGEGARFTVGDAENLWGTTWTYAQVNATSFGVAVWVHAGVDTLDTQLSALEVTVYFSLEAGFPTLRDAVLYPERHAAITFQGSYRENASGSEPSGIPEDERDAYVPIGQQLGDLARLPPSGLEDRPCELFFKATRGGFLTSEEPNPEADSGIDDIEATVSYQPTFIGRQ